MSDITNYAYIWYKKDPSKLLEFTPEEQDIIYKIILDYSFPCYLANDSIRTISEADKKELLEHELLFIQKKFEEACLVDVVIIQIPRVLYDLFNIYYKKTKDLQLIFRYDCETSIDGVSIVKKPIYNILTFNYTEAVKSNIFELNYIIINYINHNLSIITTKYNDILETILCELKIPLLDASKLIFNQIIDFEKQPSIGNTILYRGAKFDLDSTIYSYGFSSLSFNNSILSGIINDPIACTLNYFIKEIAYRANYFITTRNNKIKYIIKKFNINNLSDEYSLFFIPPIHSFLQLYCSGELWHPRTKIGNNYYKGKPIEINGLICDDVNKFIRDCDYLISDKTVEELECLYQQYKSTGQISVWQKKYLKYKNKYLEFKKYLYKLKK